MSPFRTLGLPADAGAAEIKRAYARLLRTHRPDVDPDGFQRIHEAYQACLQQLQWREQGLLDDDEDDLDDAVERLAFASTQTADGGAGAGAGGEPHAASPRADADANADAGDATQAGFGIDAFFDEFLDAARTPGIDIEAWLHDHDALYSIENKAAVADALVWRLMEEAPLQPRTLAAVLRHFELDVVNARYHMLEGAIATLRRDAAVANGEPDLSFMPERKRAKTSYGRYNWWWVVSLLWVLAHVGRMIADANP